ncbi:ATP-binding protein [Actinomadura barringtoniae]|uniref:ATP-binding protein n=1 Tax=Actinomadura barringtoniae TaxID=1427535 RepID=A0A939T9D7_9ACTN|nr:ATP-binding protein [Actinomadura barringtoniae]
MEISLTLRLPRDAASVPMVRQVLDSSLETLGVEEPVRDDLMLILSEACGNVIRHAQDCDDYSVLVAIVDDDCLIKVLDSGDGFGEGLDAAERPPSLIAEHGRGMLIMKALADQVEFRSSPEEGVLVAMEKRLRYGEDTLGHRLTAGEPKPVDDAAFMDDEDDEDADPELEEFATKLFDLARDGQTEQLVSYVDAGVPVNLTNDKGDTLLMLAAYHGHAGTVQALAARAADIERPNDRGQRPLAGAVFKKEPEVVRVLLDAGADPEAGEPSAADTARMFGHAEFLEWFEERRPTA